MVKSMTGFGSSENKSENFYIKIDIKSVNSKYFDLKIKGPRYILSMEDKIKKIISSYISRGSIQAFIDIRYIGDQGSNFIIDYNLLSSYKDKLTEISSYFDNLNNFTVLDLIKYDSTILIKDEDIFTSNEEFNNLLIETCDQACQSLLEMRLQEGYNIKTDILYKLDLMAKDLLEIDKLSDKVVENTIEKLEERISSILNENNLEIDQDRLNNEIVFYSDKLTIDEEITRLNSHIKLMEDNLNGDSSGKRLDFIAQEMNREANTIASKSNLVEITNLVINLKSNIEKIREQVQNIE